mgnify:CR=1 FL=1
MAKIGVDVGGTFTDLILEIEPEKVFVHKVPSTPADQSIGVLKGILEICEIGGISPSDVSLIVHGTTVATNITIEHNGAEVGMLTTRGFRDIIHIGRHKRPHNFSIQFDVPWQSKPLVKRRNRIPITERLLPPDGRIETPLAEDEVRAAVEKFKENGVEAVTICFLFSFLNDSHEKRAKEIVLEGMPDAYVCTSSEVVDVIREYERFSTTAMNAYVGPRTSRYLRNLAKSLQEKGIQAELRVMQSNGGIATVENMSSKAKASRPVIKLKMTWARPVLRTACEPPMVASAAVKVVPMFMPMTMAAAWGKVTVPTARAASAVATPAEEEWVIRVMAIPTPTS